MRRDPSAFSELYTRHVGDVHGWLFRRLASAAARERLGLPLDLAAEDGFTEVEQRLSPRLALERQLDALPPGEREALELRVVDELPYQELAARLDIQPAAARLRVSRALRRLVLDFSRAARSRWRVLARRSCSP